MVQPIIVARPDVRPAILVDEHKRMDIFQKLQPPHIEGGPLEDVHDFLDMCHAILCNLGLVRSNGADFTTFQLRGSPKRRWHSYE